MSEDLPHSMTEPVRPPTYDQVLAITNYLANGGLWNPEHMDHGKVSELLCQCQDALKALTKERDVLAAKLERVEASLADLRYERDVLARDIERATYDRQGWQAQCERAEASAAAMRETLGLIRQRGMWGREDEFLAKIDSALATDAGRDWVRKEDVKPLIKALNGFKWLGNNLHNVREAPDDFIGFYESALQDSNEALDDAKSKGLI